MVYRGCAATVPGPLTAPGHRIRCQTDGMTGFQEISSPNGDTPDGPPAAGEDGFQTARAWFASQGFAPFLFQEGVWAAYARGDSGLVHAPTGMGKTLAAAIGPLALGAPGAPETPPPLTLLWITPLR